MEMTLEEAKELLESSTLDSDTARSIVARAFEMNQKIYDRVIALASIAYEKGRRDVLEDAKK